MELPEDESGWLEFFIRDCIKNRVGDDMLFFVTENAHKKDGNNRVILRRFGKHEDLLGLDKEIDWQVFFNPLALILIPKFVPSALSHSLFFSPQFSSHFRIYI